MGEPQVLLSSKTLHLDGTRKLWSRFIGPFRVFELVGKIGYRLDLRGGFKDVHNVFYMSPSFASTCPGGSYASPPEIIQVEGEENALS